MQSNVIFFRATDDFMWHLSYKFLFHRPSPTASSIMSTSSTCIDVKRFSMLYLAERRNASLTRIIANSADDRKQMGHMTMKRPAAESSTQQLSALHPWAHDHGILHGRGLVPYPVRRPD
jgi:hypothetical protein